MQKETNELILSEIIKINSQLKDVNTRLDRMDHKIDNLQEEMMSNFSDMADHVTFIAGEIWNKTERRKEVYA